MSSLISLLSALVTGLITVVIFMQSKESHVDDNDSQDSVRTSFSSVLPSVILTVAVMIIQIVGGDQYNWFNIESTGNIALPAQTTTEIHFEDAINLIGYSIKESSLSSGDALELTLFWKIQNPQKNNYQVFVHLLDSNSQIVAQSDKLNPGDFPTERWPKDKYVRDTHMVEMPEGVSPGQYWIEVGLWTAGDSERLTVLDKNREVSGDTFRLPQPVIIQQ